MYIGVIVGGFSRGLVGLDVEFVASRLEPKEWIFGLNASVGVGF